MEYVEKLEVIIRNLEKSSTVKSFDSQNEKESVRLATAILDMSESFNSILQNLAPKLMNEEITEEEVNDVLLDIGEEIRHILYHINDPKYYEYIGS